MVAHTPLILAADIGGTNTRLALFQGAKLQDGSAQSYPNAEATHLYDHLARYLDSIDRAPDLVSLALAGPVNGDEGDLTNLDWHITTQQAAKICGSPRAVLLNDLQAQGYALPGLDPAHVQTLHPGAPRTAQGAFSATQLVIGLGTGMNIAAVHCIAGAASFVSPAEAGHINFAPDTPELRALADHLKGNLGHVAAEDVLSGRGIAHVYGFVSGDSKTPAEVMALCEAQDADALRAVHLIARALGSFASDMALVHLARGGVYLVGGVARALMPYLAQGPFEAGYLDKGRFSGLVGDIGVHVVRDDYAALTGAARYALQLA